MLLDATYSVCQITTKSPCGSISRCLRRWKSPVKGKNNFILTERYCEKIGIMEGRPTPIRSHSKIQRVQFILKRIYKMWNTQMLTGSMMLVMFLYVIVHLSCKSNKPEDKETAVFRVSMMGKVFIWLSRYIQCIYWGEAQAPWNYQCTTGATDISKPCAGQ